MPQIRKGEVRHNKNGTWTARVTQKGKKRLSIPLTADTEENAQQISRFISEMLDALERSGNGDHPDTLKLISLAAASTVDGLPAIRARVAEISKGFRKDAVANLRIPPTLTIAQIADLIQKPGDTGQKYVKKLIRRRERFDGKTILSGDRVITCKTSELRKLCPGLLPDESWLENTSNDHLARRITELEQLVFKLQAAVDSLADGQL